MDGYKYHKVAANPAGTVTINDLVVSGHVAVGTDTAGTATVIVGQSSVDIQFSKPYKTIPIVTTSTSAFTLVSVTRKTTSGFTLAIPTPATTSIFIDWTALEPQARP